ncbi:PA2778 family cysteine peptidase [Bdellovibrio sp. HCB337]|uniref:PA2778 family cysteine peptidase n=1 Tax=Bdellovibrio sp. HCB337 TaxID=3394358 RepID=UPI0039A61504
MNAGKTLISLVLILVGCASATPQTESLLVNARDLPKATAIEGVPFVEQAANHCGPATLTMAMNWAGKNVTVEEVTPMVFTPGAKGTFQSDMISASRRQGLVAIPLEGMNDLLKEVSAGNPVVVFENLGLTWYPQWHYAVVFGYDLQHQYVLMHSGLEANKRWDLRRFERSWKLGDYWGLVVLPPGKLSATADELSHMKAASALEQIGKIEDAHQAYQAILTRWPKSLTAAIGMGNIAYTKKDYSAAVRILKQASQYHPENAALKNNLAVAEEAVSAEKTSHKKSPTKGAFH